MSNRANTDSSEVRTAGGALVRLLATAEGVGYFPFAPGTAGSLLAAALCFPLLFLPLAVHVGATLILIVVAIWAAGRVAAELGQEDPSQVVIDEVAGMWVAAIALPPTLYDLAAVFLLYRIMDVVKPAPLPRLERLHGGLGIVADDIGAGLLAAAMWWLLKANFDFF